MGGRAAGYGGAEGGLQVAVLLGDVDERNRVPGAVARHHDDDLGCDSLDARDVLGVLGELDERGGLHALRELGVDRLVRPAPEIARSPIDACVDALDEVGVALPSVVEEGGLVDHRDSGAHRFDRVGGCAFESGARAGVDGDRLHVGRVVTREDVAFVRVAAAGEEVDEGIVAPRAVDLAPHGRELEVGQVPAGREADQVGRAADQLTVEVSHGSARAGRRVDLPAVGDALELVLAPVGEGETGAGHEVADGSRHEHLAGAGERRRPAHRRGPRCRRCRHPAARSRRCAGRRAPRSRARARRRRSRGHTRRRGRGRRSGRARRRRSTSR